MLNLIVSAGDVWEMYQDIASYLLKSTSENVLDRKKRSSTTNQSSVHIHRTTSQLLHVRFVYVKIVSKDNILLFTGIAMDSCYIFCLYQPTQPKVSPPLLRAKSAGTVKRTASRKSPSNKSANFSRELKEPGKQKIEYDINFIFITVVLRNW